MACQRGITVYIRILFAGFMARCDVCTGWSYVKLPWEEVRCADEIRCRCGGQLEPDLDTTVAEWEVGGTRQLMHVEVE
ncbi:MAG TPA: hypothetical protein VJY35_06665 [Candidatus Eisenbacteria bacterium]|nr:hypothetical protein [Candidatus Eisenbacteria bacterium]